ncbi:cytosine deaminase [Streptacidiphilus sp. MAP12-33]|uniref:hydrolase n=1 Tax=Streptacidiphilus sp. MAP12-33 TaxID=3156266 RepID=UPI00351780AF
MGQLGPEPEPGAAGPGALLLTGASLANGRTVDVRLSGDRIEAVGTAGSLRAAERLDLTGYLLLPAPAEPHAHLDEALTARSGTSAPTAPGGPDAPGTPDEEDLRRRITEAALTHLGYGSTVVRTHVLVSPATGLTRLEAALQAARDLRGLMQLQVTAMPDRLTDLRGREERALLREAARAGAHALGGHLVPSPSPSVPPSPEECLAALLDLSGSCGLPLDLHVDAAALPSTPPTGLPPRSVLTLAGTAGTAGTGTGTLLDTLLGARPGAGFGVVVLPQGGCCAAPGGFDADSARRLAESGLPFAAGSGALRDATRPVGRADPIEAAFLLAASTGLSAHAAYDAIGRGARAVLGLPDSAVEPGRPADLLALRGDTLTAALSGGHSRVVLHAGRVVSRTSAVREYADTTTAAVPRQVRPLGPA